MGQLVLVFETSLLHQVGFFEGYRLDVDPYLSVLLNPQNNRFMERDSAEQDPSFKQVIPYIVLRYRDSLFSYVRGKTSSESRLIAKRSIGLGGHIEPADRTLFTSDHQAYLEAARREVHEEVEIGTKWIERVVAVINDESSEVGKVHFGIVHLWDVAEPKVRKREGLITQSGFLHRDTFSSRWDELETWSQLALTAIAHPSIPSYQEVPDLCSSSQ